MQYLRGDNYVDEDNNNNNRDGGINNNKARRIQLWLIANSIIHVVISFHWRSCCCCCFGCFSDGRCWLLALAAALSFSLSLLFSPCLVLCGSFAAFAVELSAAAAVAATATAIVVAQYFCTSSGGGASSSSLPVRIAVALLPPRLPRSIRANSHTVLARASVCLRASSASAAGLVCLPVRLVKRWRRRSRLRVCPAARSLHYCNDDGDVVAVVVDGHSFARSCSLLCCTCKSECTGSHGRRPDPFPTHNTNKHSPQSSAFRVH